MSLHPRLIAAVAALACAGPGMSQAPGRTTVSGGAFLHNGRPFPMVLDAGTDCFTPQDDDTVMASKDAWGWLQRAETGMTEVATTRGIPHGSPYEDALQKREFAYAAYNDGAWGDAIRLARELLDICDRLKAQKRP